jgi:aminopeptidase YwaD
VPTFSEAASPEPDWGPYNSYTDPMTERTCGSPLQIFLILFFLVTFSSFAAGQATAPAPHPAAPTHKTPVLRRVPAFASWRVCAACIRAHMDFLASDALRGRGSGTPDELVAATYIAAQFQQYGIQPAGDHGGFIQKAVFEQQKLKAPPTLKFQAPIAGKPGETVVWTHGKEILVRFLPKLQFAGPLKRVDSETPGQAGKVEPGMVALVLGHDNAKMREATADAFKAGAVAVLAEAPESIREDWEERGHELPRPPKRLKDDANPAFFEGFGDLILLSADALAQLHHVPDGTVFALESEAAPAQESFTWNAVGKIRGRDPALRASVVLLSAHLDHLGIGPAVNGDTIYNGADDDASGTTAVLELARAIALGPRQRRTVIFALFGSEEAGGLGSTWFRGHPPVPLKDIAANLEFEMIGRADPMYPKDVLWLTGWERSNLGPALAAHGAKLVADKRPDQQFFRRSDNYILAKKGVVAQTVSSFGLHADYHQPSDDLSHIDFAHMTTAIGSMIRPVEWLLNSSFRPTWRAEGRP